MILSELPTFPNVCRARTKRRRALKCQEVAGNLALRRVRAELELEQSEQDRYIQVWPVCLVKCIARSVQHMAQPGAC